MLDDARDNARERVILEGKGDARGGNARDFL